jgi:hypothetical protein
MSSGSSHPAATPPAPTSSQLTDSNAPVFTIKPNEGWAPARNWLATSQVEK